MVKQKYKICTKCKIEKPINEFKKVKSDNNEYCKVCNDCKNKIIQEKLYKKEHPKIQRSELLLSKEVMKDIHKNINVNNNYSKDKFNNLIDRIKIRKDFKEIKKELGYPECMWTSWLYKIYLPNINIINKIQDLINKKGN